MDDDSKRSDFPCPGIISGRSRSTSQARETRAIQEGVEAKLARRQEPKARAQHARNEDFLAQKRRDTKKGRRS